MTIIKLRDTEKVLPSVSLKNFDFRQAVVSAPTEILDPSLNVNVPD